MRWFLTFLFLIALSAVAQAQTTFSVGATCSSDWTIVGGLALTNNAATNATTNCQANTSKASGKWYFTTVITTPGWTGAVGVALGSIGLPGDPNAGGQGIGTSTPSAGWQ